MLGAGNAVYTELKNLVVWNKSNAGQGSFYRSQHELIFAYKHGDGAHTNNFELGQHGRNRSNVWTHAGINTFRAGRMDELTLHPTVKPIALVADAMRDCSRRGDIVLDPFIGSGTTILAAERVGRRAYGLKATSVGGVLTGLGGNMIILDDPQKPVDAQSKLRRDTLNQWFTNTLMSRLDNKETGAIIVVSQRTHMDDLSGHLISGSGDWEVLSLPAIAEADERVPIGDDEVHVRLAGTALHPEHESLEMLHSLQKDLGTYDFGAQYQQAPIPEGGAMVKREWIRWYDKPPERTSKTKILLSVDPASKDGPHNSYSAFAAIQVEGDDYYVLDMMRGRFDFPELREKTLALAERYKPTAILIEDTSSGTGLAQELRRKGLYRIKAVPVDRDKVTRLFVQTAKFEAGRVHIPKDAPFVADLLAELLAFPHGKHDDQVDAISQALAYKLSTYTLDNI